MNWLYYVDQCDDWPFDPDDPNSYALAQCFSPLLDGYRNFEGWLYESGKRARPAIVNFDKSDISPTPPRLPELARLSAAGAHPLPIGIRLRDANHVLPHLKRFFLSDRPDLKHSEAPVRLKGKARRVAELATAREYEGIDPGLQWWQVNRVLVVYVDEKPACLNIEHMNGTDGRAILHAMETLPKSGGIVMGGTHVADYEPGS